MRLIPLLIVLIAAAARLIERIFERKRQYSGGADHRLVALINLNSDKIPANIAHELLPGWRIVQNPPKYADFMYSEGEYLSSYNIPAKLRQRFNTNVLWDKAALHNILSAEAPAAVCKTFTVNDTSTIPDGSVYIVRANWGWAGKANGIATSTAELQNLYKKLSNPTAEAIIDSRIKTPVVIASEYIVDPMLYKGYKFHLRLYAIIMISEDREFVWFVNEGTIVPAAKPYQADDWANEDIHDTHLSRNPALIGKYPANLPQVPLSTLTAFFTEVFGVLLPHVRKYAEVKYNYDFVAIDLMITADGHPKVIEFNKYPSRKVQHTFINYIIAGPVREVFGPKYGDPALVTKIIDRPRSKN